MSHIFVRCERVIYARPEEVFDTLADYIQRHPRILPSNFLNYRVERGGWGDGTVISYRFQAAGREREYRMRIEETVKGQVLTERDLDSSLVTRWSVLPVDHGLASRVRIESDWEGGSGIGGFFERTFAPAGLRKIYNQILTTLALQMQTPEQNQRIMLADKKHLKLNTTTMVVALSAALGVAAGITYLRDHQRARV
ncbi:MAG TPA: SRPBCC family protein [Ktedonobacteraceae bacterium]|nr:SRPBCC family protein [Ktedonobacteraceae bacterium]